MIGLMETFSNSTEHARLKRTDHALLRGQSPTITTVSSSEAAIPSSSSLSKPLASGTHPNDDKPEE